MAVKNALLLLEEFCAAGIVVEVTHRSRRRIFGLAGLAPLRNEVAPPRRPQPGRGRGRPPLLSVEVLAAPEPLEPLTHRLEQPEFDYSNLAQYVAEAERAIRQTRRRLDPLILGMAAGFPAPDPLAPVNEDKQPELEDKDAWFDSMADEVAAFGPGEPDHELE